MARASVRTAALLIAVLSLAACDSLAWYLQAAQGHLSIVTSRRDMRELLNDPELAPVLAAKLELALEARQFAADELGLPAGGNFLEFVQLERRHAVWNVFAAPEFSLEPVVWCYPIAGCAAYRGYFSESDAQAYAAELQARGFDVYVGGVDAYSTLGWFDDALLSTVIARPDHQLAALIFHELAHQVAYVPDDTTLSESFATVVEMEGLRRWLETRQQSELLDAARADAERRRRFIDFVSGFRGRFEELYGREMSEADMRREKAGLQQRMRDEYRALKTGWGGNAGYDGWFSRPLNNAQLATVGSYNDLAPQLREILRQVGNDLPAFYGRMRELTRMSPERRAEYLDSLEPGALGACAGPRRNSARPLYQLDSRGTIGRVADLADHGGLFKSRFAQGRETGFRPRPGHRAEQSARGLRIEQNLVARRPAQFVTAVDVSFAQFVVGVQGTEDSFVQALARAVEDGDIPGAQLHRAGNNHLQQMTRKAEAGDVGAGAGSVFAENGGGAAVGDEHPAQRPVDPGLARLMAHVRRQQGAAAEGLAQDQHIALFHALLAQGLARFGETVHAQAELQFPGLGRVAAKQAAAFFGQRHGAAEHQFAHQAAGD